jgi:hypothetical protein
MFSRYFKDEFKWEQSEGEGLFKSLYSSIIEIYDIYISFLLSLWDMWMITIRILI